MSDEQSKHERAARIAELKRLKQSGELKFKTEADPIVLDSEVEKTVLAIHAVTDVAKQSAVKVGAQLMGAAGKGKKALVKKLQVGQQGSVHANNDFAAEIERTASADEVPSGVLDSSTSVEPKVKSDFWAQSAAGYSKSDQFHQEVQKAVQERWALINVSADSIKEKSRWKVVVVSLAILVAVGIGCGVYLKVIGTKGVAAVSPTVLPAVAPVDPFAVASESLGGSTEPLVDQEVPRVTNIEPTQDQVDVNSQSNADSNDSPKEVVRKSQSIPPAHPQTTEGTTAPRARQQEKTKVRSQNSPADDWQKRASDDLDKWAEQF